MKEKKKSKFLWIILSVIAALLVFVGICVAGATDYNARVPKISVKETLEVTSGTTLSVSELAEITCKNPYTVRLEITDTNVNSARVLEGDKPQLYVGDEAGYVRLLIIPCGTVAELVSENVTIYVKPGEAQQQAILEEAKAQYGKIREYMEERDFFDQKEALEEELVTLYYFDPVRQIGYAKYYLKRVPEAHKELYYEISANYELVSRETGPRLKDVLEREIDAEAFRQAQSDTEKVKLIKES